MKTLYIECNMGAAGDMLMSALSELHPDAEGFMTRLSQIGIPDVAFERRQAVKCGIVGTHIEVRVNGISEGEEVHEHTHSHEEHVHHHEEEHTYSHEGHAHHHEEEHAHSHKEHVHHHEEEHTHSHEEHDHHHEHHHTHSHRSMAEIAHIISHLQVSDSVKEHATAVYRLIAEAESQVHGREVSEIHFHEVGTMDAIADIVGVCMLIEELHPDRILASPVHVGSGQVRCAHGILPVPAPATALMLKDVPIYGGQIQGELCTPTGAALLKHFVTEFVPMPAMQVKQIGYGMGNKDFEMANCVRVLMGEQQNTEGEICELSCNMDDMTGEEIAYAMNMLLEHGAREVFTTAVGMKKNRPGILLTCLCDTAKRQEMLELIFKHTTTIGIREKKIKRYILDRRIEETQTPYGIVHTKVSEGYGTVRRKPEYEDLAKIAAQQDKSLMEIKKNL